MAKSKEFQGYSDDPDVVALFWKLLPGMIRAFSPNGDIYPRLPNLIAALLPSNESYMRAMEEIEAQADAAEAAPVAKRKTAGGRSGRFVRAGRHTWVRDRS